MKRLRLKEGDVFSIEIDANSCAFGQIIYKGHRSGPLYICIFGAAHSRSAPVELPLACSGDIALVGATMDARIFHGMWKLVGHHTPVTARIPRPLFTVECEGKLVLEDFDGHIVREASQEDDSLYGRRWSRSPIAYEKAIQALHGVGEWLPDFDKLTMQHSLERTK